MNQMKRILIADDHSIVRYGLNIFLSKQYKDYVVDEAWDAETVMKQMKKNEYELVLLDLIMPDSDPNTLLHWIRNFYPKSKVLILSTSDEELFGMRSIQLGAAGFLRKDAPSKEMINALDTVMSGKKYVSKELAETILDSTLNGKPANPFESLTPREFQVAMYLAQDYTLKQIGEMLQIQYTTANTFKLRIFEKLDIKNQRDLMQLASVYSFGRK
jgi:DNA-binding NarL/FixJ family response regulator